MNKTTAALTAAGALALVAITWSECARVRRLETTAAQALAGQSHAVTTARAELAAMTARHDAAIQAQQVKVAAAQLETAEAVDAAAGIRIRTAAELRDARAAAATVEADRDLLAQEVESRGRKIEGLQLVIARQRYQIGTLDALARTTATALQEQRQQTDATIASMQAVVAQALKAEARARRRFIIYAGAGESVAPGDGWRPRFAAQVGGGVVLIRLPFGG
jgi:hypothetical protein